MFFFIKMVAMQGRTVNLGYNELYGNASRYLFVIAVIRYNREALRLN
jgi:hypothetical protein